MTHTEHNWGIVGHEWAVDYLRRSIASGRGAHAYLFAGPPNIGKSLLALRLAQALVCESSGPDPCLECRACQRAVRGNHPDVRITSMQSQAADERVSTSTKLGIDTVRFLQSEVFRRPYEAKHRAFIIEDAHMLTDQASNAMLKTLEEPPSYTTLILVAQGAGDLLPTVVSRCRILRLRPLPRAVVAAALRDRYQLADEDAALVAAWSGGRIGWALRAVEQPELLEQQQQRLDDLIRLGMASRVERVRWAEERAKEYRGGESSEALEWVRLWQSWWRDVLLLRGGAIDAITHLDRRPELEELARSISLEASQHFLRRLDDARQQLADNVNPQLVFENAALHVPSP